MFEHLDDENTPKSDSRTLDAVNGRAAGLRRRNVVVRVAVATVAVAALLGVAAGATARTVGDDPSRTAAASAEDVEAPGEPEVGTPPPSTTPPTTAPKAPPTTMPGEVAGEQVEAPAPTAPAPAAPAPAPTGSYQGTVVAPSGWTVDIAVSGPGGSATFTGLTNGSPFSKAGVKTGTYTLEWTAESSPAPPGPGGTEIGTAMLVGRQTFTVSEGQTTSVTVVV